MGTVPFLELRGISKVFPSNHSSIEVLRDISYTVQEGTFLAIVGPSGCGKTTLLRIVAGLMNPTYGKLLLNNVEIHGPGRDRGMVFQSYTSFPWLTVRENIEFGLRLQKLSSDEIRKISDRFIELIDLKNFENAYPETLSGGMKQRVAIARMLANDPSILLMDEPFGALDYQTRWSMQELLLHVWEEMRKTVIFVTHDIDEALFLSDRTLIITALPGKVKRDILVPFDRPRLLSVKSDPKFAKLKNDIIALIREDGVR